MNFTRIFTLLALVVSLASCGSSKRSVATASPAQLSDEEQRRYDYYYLEAVRQNGQGNYTGAYNLLEHCLAINPKAPSALYEMSQYYQFLGRAAEAQQALETAVEGAPDNYWYAQALVNFYQRLGNKEKTVELLETMTERFPERHETLYALASAYGESGDDKKMVETLDKLEELMGKSEQLTMEKANAYIRCGENKKAIEEIKSLGDEPDNAMAIMLLLNYYEKNGQTDEYEKLIDTALSSKTISPDNKRDILLDRVSYIETSKQDSTAAIALFEKAAASENCDASILVLYAQYLWEKKMQTESRPVLERALALDPEDKMARLMLLQLAIQGSDYTLVKSVCATGIEVQPDVLEFYLYLAIAYNQDGRTDDALEVVTKAVEHIDGTTGTALAADIYSIQGDLLHEKGRADDAYSAYDEALKYAPDNVGVLNNYAYYLSVEKRELDKAEEMSYKTIKAEPNNATYLDTYAWILFVKGLYTEARTYIEQALKDLGEDKGVIKEHCGDIYYMTGDTAQAVDFWTQAVKDGNDSAVLKEKIRRKKYITE
jgi:tetratricopeptide (TPR) repeat protein